MTLSRGSLNRPKIKATFSKSMFDSQVSLVCVDLNETYTTRLNSDFEEMKIKATFLEGKSQRAKIKTTFPTE